MSPRPTMPSFILATALALLAAACTPADFSRPRTQPPAPQEMTTSHNAAAASEALAAAFSDAGFTVDANEGGLSATSHDARHAACRTIWVRDRFKDDGNRGRFTQPDSTTTTVEMGIVGLTDQTRVRWQARHAGRYRDVFTNLTFTAPCPGSGTVDAIVRDALAG